MTAILGKLALAAVPQVPPAERSELDVALERAMPGRRRLRTGAFACDRCGGQGLVDVVYGHPNDPDAPGGYEECPSCRGQRCEECVSCGEPARLEGADADYVYCSPECAGADGNAPGTRAP